MANLSRRNLFKYLGLAPVAPAILLSSEMEKQVRSFIKDGFFDGYSQGAPIHGFLDVDCKEMEVVNVRTRGPWPPKVENGHWPSWWWHNNGQVAHDMKAGAFVKLIGGIWWPVP
jgi:hypothetical protein